MNKADELEKRMKEILSSEYNPDEIGITQLAVREHDLDGIKNEAFALMEECKRKISELVSKNDVDMSEYASLLAEQAEISRRMDILTDRAYDNVAAVVSLRHSKMDLYYLLGNEVENYKEQVVDNEAEITEIDAQINLYTENMGKTNEPSTMNFYKLEIDRLKKRKSSLKGKNTRLNNKIADRESKRAILLNGGPNPFIVKEEEPTLETTEEQVVEPVVKPVVKPVVDPVVEPVVEPVVDPTTGDDDLDIDAGDLFDDEDEEDKTVVDPIVEPTDTTEDDDFDVDAGDLFDDEDEEEEDKTVVDPIVEPTDTTKDDKDKDSEEPVETATVVDVVEPKKSLWDKLGPIFLAATSFLGGTLLGHFIKHDKGATSEVVQEVNVNIDLDDVNDKDMDDTPDVPSGPSTFDTPSTPSTPSTPDTPSTPSTPDKPDKPNTPSESDESKDDTILLDHGDTVVKDGVEVTYDGSTYVNGDFTVKQELNVNGENLAEVTNENLSATSNEATYDLAPTGNESTYEEATATMTDSQKASLNQDIDGFDWAGFFDSSFDGQLANESTLH